MAKRGRKKQPKVSIDIAVVGTSLISAKDYKYTVNQLKNIWYKPLFSINVRCEKKQ